MELHVTTGDVTRIETPALVVNLYQGVRKPAGATGAVDAALDGHIRALIEIPTVAELACTADVASLEALRPAAREIVQAAVSGDLIAYVEADTRFHLGLLALAPGAAAVVESYWSLAEIATRPRLSFTEAEAGLRLRLPPGRTVRAETICSAVSEKLSRSSPSRSVTA